MLRKFVTSNSLSGTDPDNTRTPLIAWGAGIRGPVPSSTFSDTHDAYSEPWDLSHLARQDVQQADIATMMAVLLGINIPVNSVGVIPDIDVNVPGYMQLREGEKAKARAALANAKVMIEHYRVKHGKLTAICNVRIPRLLTKAFWIEELKASHAVLYEPFRELVSSQDLGQAPGTGRLIELEDSFNAGEYDLVRQRATVLQLALSQLVKTDQLEASIY